MEYPIIFNSEEVKAILEGRKTQTRKVVKPQPVKPKEGAYFDSYNKTEQWNWWSPEGKQFLSQIIKCPYGKVGDRLWVRETFAQLMINPYADDYFYKADNPQHPQKGMKIKWTPSTQMPRWASRITLEITDIRVEGLQEISEEDAKKEGCILAKDYEELSKTFFTNPYKEVFIELWNSLAKEDFKWNDNPWVWVINFRRFR